MNLSIFFKIKLLFNLNYNKIKNINNNKLFIGNIYNKNFNIIKECSMSIRNIIYKTFNSNIKSIMKKYKNTCINFKNNLYKIIFMYKNNNS